MALKGIKVLEFAGLAPGPFCGMVLSDFGATVIRIDKVKGDASFDVLGGGKQSIAVDLKNPKGVSLIRDLAKKSDVLIEPFRAGVMERLGLGPETLLKDNSRLVYARLTGFGQKGPYSMRAGHDINYIGLSGLLSMFGRSGDKPMFPVNFAADFGGGGLMCAMGILVALYERSVSGKGQTIDCDMVSGTAYLGSWLMRSQKLPIWGDKRGCNILDSGAHFYEVYETKDGKFMTVGAFEPQFYKELLQGLKIPELEQYDTETGKKVLKKKFLEKTRDEWCEIFDSKDACVFPLLTIDEAVKHRHNEETGTFLKNTKETIVPNPAPRLSRTPGQSQAAQKSPNVGDHTVKVLENFGYTKEEISKLDTEGIIEIAKSKL